MQKSSNEINNIISKVNNNNFKIKYQIIDNLNKAQKEQEQLIEIFKKGNNFIDESFHEQLLESAKTYGDLRHRDLSLHSLQHQSESFYTKAFGGVYDDFKQSGPGTLEIDFIELI